MRGSTWTEEEKEFLANNWHKGREYCAKKLNRTVTAVNVKAKRMGLGGCIKNSHFLTAQNVADLLGVDIKRVLNWVQKGLLRFSLAKAKRKIYLIELEELERFLKENLDLWDSRKMKGSLWINDPDWLVQKRKSDRSRPANEGKKWTPEEDKKAISLFKTGDYTYAQIGELLGRSGNSVERRISRLDVWGTGEFIRDKR
ncbi:helix-turn-helix protein [Anoxybacillus vitaminiphilus]|uniref:Helix-turn-helix protein n=1 Tax=Paranoxybacillus vitaminiphilus TaxID=581036 RepID=A0A327YSY5_9BACL|nr:sigma factor-like helix-turn-helix DNA-binding protein [Anoxybacillus vitaminiphilus]RAK21119.1 helix-turn-helix protein [Anoxybacillus vitaminiphilus]